MRSVITPMKPRQSQYGVDPKYIEKRVSEYPEMTSVLIDELFQDMPSIIYPSPKGVESVKEATVNALKHVDMSMIKPCHSVNILASHHGFTLFGGEPYAELLKTIRDVIEERTGSDSIRLRAGVGLRFRETEEYIKSFGLDKHFKGKAQGVAPIDEGIPIETEIGTLYGLKAIYDSDWIVHAHNSDVREVHFHRQVDRAVKPFGMSYARIDTRSTYHQNMGPRASNFVARSIFSSDFVQQKFAFAAFIEMTPIGIKDVIADNDLLSLNDRITVSGCKYYGKIMTLLGEIDECIVGLDFPAPVPYVFAAGVIFANFAGSNVDIFDLDNPLPPYTWYTEAFYGKNRLPLVEGVPSLNPAIKAVIHNYAWGGYPSTFFAEHLPTIVVGNEQAETIKKDPQNIEYIRNSVVAEGLDSAIDFAYKTTGSKKVIIFDGAIGGINVSKDLAELLHNRAPSVDNKVENELLPKWLKQRGIDPAMAEAF